MFREMRRKRQLLPEAESIAILEKMTNGVLAVEGDDDYPYAVPISYVYRDGHIYLHSAVSGHKIDAILRNPKVSFCVTEKDDVKGLEFTTYFRSVIAFGKAHIVEDTDEVKRILRLLAGKYSSMATEQATKEEIDSALKRVKVIDITIDYLTGKEAIELTRKRN